jgi:hypothetical protein
MSLISWILASFDIECLILLRGSFSQLYCVLSVPNVFSLFWVFSLNFLDEYFEEATGLFFDRFSLFLGVFKMFLLITGLKVHSFRTFYSLSLRSWAYFCCLFNLSKIYRSARAIYFVSSIDNPTSCWFSKLLASLSILSRFLTAKRSEFLRISGWKEGGCSSVGIGTLVSLCL